MANAFKINMFIRLDRLLLESSKMKLSALTSVDHLVGCHSANGRVAGVVPGQFTCLGCWFGP